MGRPRVPQARVEAMYAMYNGGSSLSATARHFERSPASLRNLFEQRGLPRRQSTGFSEKRKVDGTFEKAPLLTKAEVDAMIAAATRITVPPALKLEWRKWDLQRRGDFIRRVRERLKNRNDRPTTPFSINVRPFDYTSPEAWAIARANNHGKDSRSSFSKLKPCSQGVIWNGKLWFWTQKVGYVEGCPWTPGKGRPMLTHAIWADHHRRPMPEGHVLSYIDGNPNNLDPYNLELKSRNTVCRENQSGALTKRSREELSLILKRQQTPCHDTITKISGL